MASLWTQFTMRALIATVVFGTLALAIVDPAGIIPDDVGDSPMVIAFIAIAGSVAGHYFPGNGSD